MANSISTETLREKYAMSRLDHNLRRRLVAAGVMKVDTTDNKIIECPFVTTDGAAIGALAGTYSVGDVTVTNDKLEVTEYVAEAVHIFDFETRFNDFDLFTGAIDEMTFNIGEKIDRFALNEVVDNAGVSIATPSGGFAQANIDNIFGDIAAAFTGYADAMNGVYLVIENTEVSGLVQNQVLTGFSYRDAVAKNGLAGEYMGVEIYVTRTGTFVDATVGTQTFTNANNRLAGVKNTATFANIRSGGYEEKMVSGKTGKEVVVYGYTGAKVWSTKANLTADVVLTA